MNPGFSQLQPYPFAKLRDLFRGIQPDSTLEPINLSIGEPKHPTPECIFQAAQDSLHLMSKYPATRATPELCESIVDWLTQRFHLASANLTTDNVLSVNGTREALFAFAQFCVDSSQSDALVVSPNPFYQIYEGAALLAGARPWYIEQGTTESMFMDLSSVSDETWQRCQLIYLCSPNNPTGTVFSRDFITRLFELAEQHDFIIASDECYSEIYLDETDPPAGLLQYAHELGNSDFKRCVVFHSLSKRSNVPGLRSGFVAGDAALMQDFFLYRTYHGCAMSLQTQQASISAWRDEAHVQQNRALYRAKFSAVEKILKPVLDVNIPAATFYLWPKVPIDDQEFARGLYAQQNVTVLPGSYIGRAGQSEDNKNPGKNRLRIALVDSLELCEEAANRIKTYMQSL